MGRHAGVLAGGLVLVLLTWLGLTATASASVVGATTPRVLAQAAAPVALAPAVTVSLTAGQMLFGLVLSVFSLVGTAVAVTRKWTTDSVRATAAQERLAETVSAFGRRLESSLADLAADVHTLHEQGRKREIADAGLMEWRKGIDAGMSDHEVRIRDLEEGQPVGHRRRA